ncbi:hypothetical protein BpHYR1_012254 [Brachionus plicatilis]|uniref:Uncharacterized protein n=1 Tax=Brachionus plicatilis TaxID=10195 RepID=A0A3M7S927_BRAPC|nr:hypothetical protein BpHYR1_012254 [Brachionus plicatilis]
MSRGTSTTRPWPSAAVKFTFFLHMKILKKIYIFFAHENSEVRLKIQHLLIKILKNIVFYTIFRVNHLECVSNCEFIVQSVGCYLVHTWSMELNGNKGIEWFCSLQGKRKIMKKIQ